MSMQLVPYIFLYLTVMSLWIPKIKAWPAWPFLLVLTVILGLVSQQLRFEAFIPIVAFPIAMLLLAKSSLWLIRFLSAIMVLLLSVGLFLHLFPGFHNLLAINHVYLTADAAPYTMTLNIDKTLVGIFFLGMSLKRIATAHDWLTLLKSVIVKIVCLVVLLAILGYLLGFMVWEPKVSSYFPLWFITNLLFVCTAEEAFFRGFIQKNLANLLQKIRFGKGIAISLSALIFGLAHFAGGQSYILLATIAGLGYGLLYERTQRIEASILAHFATNTTQFLLFTYPMLSH